RRQRLPERSAAELRVSAVTVAQSATAACGLAALLSRKRRSPSLPRVPMLNCPLCKKKVPPLEPECPSCHANLSLLADYVGHLAGGLDRAEALTRAGLLDEAVTAYLEVLEVDPDNAIARRQVGRVVAAVRQFDNVARSRRWLK